MRLLVLRDEFQGQVQEEQTRQKEIATRDEFDKRKVKELEKRLSEARGQVATKQTAVGNYTQQATSLGERPETLRKVHDIATEITNLEKSVRKIEVTTENTDELVDKYQQMQEKFTKISALLNCLNNDIRELNTAIDKRSRHYQLTENFFITFIKHSFNKIMEVRQFQVIFVLFSWKQVLKVCFRGQSTLTCKARNWI